MKTVKTIVMVICFVTIGVFVWKYPTSSVKTAEVVKTDQSGVEYTYQEFERYNCFDYCVGTEVVMNWD